MIDALLAEATRGDLSGLTLWLTPDGNWQASARSKASGGW